MFEDFKGKYVMVRTTSAGVFSGTLESCEGDVVKLKNARRIWYWSGAASLSQLAMDGTSDTDNCKFPCEVSEAMLFGVIEIIIVTEKARKSIAAVTVWAK